MTIPYNSTKYANIYDMKEDFNKVIINKETVYISKKNKDIVLKNLDFNNICYTLYICLYRDFPKLELVLKYFKEIAKISTKLGISIPWCLPTGLKVKQKYFSSKKIKMKPFLYSKDLLTINILDKKNFNNRKQIRSLMPNLVHSLDAASLGILIDNFFKEDKNKNFYAIHDCFAVTCNNVNLIYELLKLSYCKVYSNHSFLMNFHNLFKNSILNQFGNSCYSEENNTIIIVNSEGEKLKIILPDINKVFKPEVIDYRSSSYCMH